MWRPYCATRTWKVASSESSESLLILSVIIIILAGEVAYFVSVLRCIMCTLARDSSQQANRLHFLATI